MTDTRGRITAHFTWPEFACRDYFHTPYPDDWRSTRALPLAHELEALRAWLCAVKGRDVPLILDSVYRTAAHNKAVGGRPRSQHVYGRAVDVRCPFGCTFAEFEDAVRGVAGRVDSKIRYLCVYRHQGFIHLDIRDAEELTIEEAP
jgi:uncharacterized protein YcbK (DUF882 family)